MIGKMSSLSINEMFADLYKDEQASCRFIDNMNSRVSGMKTKTKTIQGETCGICFACGANSKPYACKKSSTMWRKLHNKVCVGKHA